MSAFRPAKSYFTLFIRSSRGPTFETPDLADESSAMIEWQEYFRSVELIWAAWIVSLIGFTTLTAIACRALSWRRLAVLFQRERGASYALPYVLVFPFYLLLMCVLIEATLILIVKMGTVYAAFAGARSAIVWSTATEASGPDRNDRVKLAVLHAMVPFASSNSSHTRSPNSLSIHGASESDFIAAYKKFAPQGKASDEYLRQKFRCALYATEFEVPPIPDPTTGGMTAKVTYRYPFHVPGVGLFLGYGKDPHGGSFYICRITSEAKLQNEAPKHDRWAKASDLKAALADLNKGRKILGIEYVSR